MAIWDERHSLWASPQRLATNATWSVVGGTVAGAYPLANLSDRFSHTVTRSIGGTLIVKATFPAPVTLDAVAVINHNATSINVSNNAPMGAVPIFVPWLATQVPADSLLLDPWVDLRNRGATRTASEWTVSFDGLSSGIAIGEIVLVTTFTILDFLIATVRRRESHPVIRHQTDGGVSWRYQRGFRARGVAGIVNKKSLEKDVLENARGSHGGALPGLLVVNSRDDLDNYGFGPDALYVELVNDIEMQWGHPSITVVQLEFQELGKGARVV